MEDITLHYKTLHSNLENRELDFFTYRYKKLKQNEKSCLKPISPSNQLVEFRWSLRADALHQEPFNYYISVEYLSNVCAQSKARKNL
jgi:hypothetical protein